MAKKDRFGCCNRPKSNSPLWDGPGFSRRQFFQLAGTGLTGYYFTQVTRPLDVLAASNVTTMSTARNVIFIFLRGAASHVDTFDLKEGPWTPSDFAPTSYGEIRFPQGLMPNIANVLDRLTIVRSVQAWAAVHGLAQIWTQIARNPTSGMGKIAPNLGAVAALEKQDPEGKLPGFISLGGRPVGAGYLPSQYSPFRVAAGDGGGLAASTHPQGQERFQSRMQLLNELDGSLREESPMGREAEDMGIFYQQAEGLMYDPDVEAAFQYSPEEIERYGSTGFGASCLLARNVLKANIGTRYIQLDLGGWDNHANIYAPNAGHYLRCRQLDGGLGPLITDLEQTPGVAAEKSLLDETLIVVMGEFGRTVADLNSRAGRDHYLQQFTVFAGGGTRGGHVVGATNSTGAYTTDPGWSENRVVRPEDVAASIYSAMGIDWTTVRYDDPFGRGFSYIPFAEEEAYVPIQDIFV